METTVANETEQMQLPDWVAKLVEEVYARGVADGREQMRVAAQGVVAIAGRDLGRIRLLPAGMAKPKAA
jgi:hypothetical protein